MILHLPVPTRRTFLTSAAALAAGVVLPVSGLRNALRERVEIAFVADNPGDGMFHCHILEHQAAGMMGVIRGSGKEERI
nr:multicopper oxidase domain-containing protein [Martelella mediterranea]